jgi:hypothetical protein
MSQIYEENMKLKVLFVFILLLSFSQQNIYSQHKKKVNWADSLVGNWETVHNPLETSTLRFEFKTNKNFNYLLSSSWKGTYKLDGTKLISSLYIPLMNKYKNDTSTVLIFSDTLIQIGKDTGIEKTSKLIRKKDVANAGFGLVGTWVMQNEEAEYSTITYSQSGTFEIKNILKSFKGNYTTKGDTLMVFSLGHMMLKNRIVLDKQKLRIYSPTQSGPVTLEKTDK